MIPYGKGYPFAGPQGAGGWPIGPNGPWATATRNEGSTPGLKYRLYMGRAGQTLVRYDNEAGKGDHRHLGGGEVEVPYEFSSLEKVLSAFRVECEQLGWRWSE